MITTITQSDPNYPYMLTCMPKSDRPAQLYCAGNTSLLAAHCIGFTGSKDTTRAGQQTAFNIAAHFASAGYTIVSGMCPGTDMAAHKGALSVGGTTIAVLGCALDLKDFRAPQHESFDFARKIIDGGGLLITEYDQGPASGKRYLKRNEILAALSLVVIPVQCEGSQSGTMATVRRAAKYRREIWVPNPLAREASAPQYAGIWELMRQGGPILADRIITSKADYPGLLDELSTLASSTPRWHKFYN